MSWSASALRATTAPEAASPIDSAISAPMSAWRSRRVETPVLVADDVVERRDHPDGEHGGGAGAGCAQHDAFAGQIARDAPAARAEREADGELFAPSRRDGEQQIRDVRARDEQDETDRGFEQRQD